MADLRCLVFLLLAVQVFCEGIIAHTLYREVQVSRVQFTAYPIVICHSQEHCGETEVFRTTVILSSSILTADLVDSLLGRGVGALLVAIGRDSEIDLLQDWQEVEARLLSVNSTIPVAFFEENLGELDIPWNSTEYRALVNPVRGLGHSVVDGRKPISLSNVVGSLLSQHAKSTGHKEAIVVLCHWDTFSTVPGLAKGATAAASAVAMLEIAKEMKHLYSADSAPFTSIYFVLASGARNLNYTGARAWAREYIGETTVLKAVIVLDNLLTRKRGGADFYVRGSAEMNKDAWRGLISTLERAASISGMSVAALSTDAEEKDTELNAITEELALRQNSGKIVPVLVVSASEKDEILKDTLFDVPEAFNESCESFPARVAVIVDFLRQSLYPDIDMLSTQNQISSSYDLEASKAFMMAWLETLTLKGRMIPYSTISRARAIQRKVQGPYPGQSARGITLRRPILESFLDTFETFVNVQYHTFRVNDYLDEGIRFSREIYVEIEFVETMSALSQGILFAGAIFYLVMLYFAVNWYSSGIKLKIF